MLSKKVVGEMDNKDLLKEFRSVISAIIVEVNSRRGLTKGTEKAEKLLTEELCLRLGFEYNPDDWHW